MAAFGPATAGVCVPAPSRTEWTAGAETARTFAATTPESAGMLAAPKLTRWPFVPEKAVPLIFAVVDVVPPAAIAVSPVIAGVCVPIKKGPYRTIPTRDPVLTLAVALPNILVLTGRFDRADWPESLHVVPGDTVPSMR